MIKRLAEKCKTNQISCIAQSKETFYSLIIHNFDNRNIRLRFIDCSRHLPFSLDRWSNYLSNKYDNTHNNS